MEECSKSKIHKSELNLGTEVLILSTSLIRAGEIFVSVAGSLFTINEQAITNACLYLSFLLRIMLVKRYFHKLAFTLKNFCLRDRGRLGNEGQPILRKIGTQSRYVDLCNMPKF